MWSGCLGMFGSILVWFVWMSLVLISGLLLGLCFVFAPDLFGVDRLGFCLRVLFGGLLLVLFVELASFVLFNVPVALGLDAGALGLHWGGVELSFCEFSLSILAICLFVVCLVWFGCFCFSCFARWVVMVGGSS